ncbi:Uma2 family endonuclease [Sorangium sp. So ce887]|uniref:Uma2 family endonuclease n=1 Tax=Sorangium sp. So ce887 TaxID=3133324 RepID=UPI003F6075D2
MVLRLPDDYRIDPEDPRAPLQETWDSMSPEQRARVVAMLPSEFTLEAAPPPEGDTHTKAATGARFTLDAFFRRIGRRIYISSNLAVYYPGERYFAPDVLAVRDVEPHDREKWVVSTEGRGLDLAIEVHVLGSRQKDEIENVERYARLGIEEYFYFDRRRRILQGYRLPSAREGSVARPCVYRPIVPQEGRFSSEVLGLDIMLEGDRLRFLHGSDVVLEADELITRLGAALNEALASKEDAERRAQAEADRAQAEADRAQAEADRAALLEKDLAEARAELDRLRRAKDPPG